MAVEQFGKAFNDHMAQQDDREVVTVLNIAGKDVTFYVPSGGQIMGLSLLAEQGDDPVAMASNVAQLLMGLTDDEGAHHMQLALMHRSNPLPPDVLAAIVHRLTEEWTARPTEPLSESSPQGQRPGNSSTAKSQRSATARSSTSRRSASAT